MVEPRFASPAADHELIAVEDLAANTRHAMATGPFGSSVGQHTFRSSGVPLLRGSNLSSEVGVRLDDDGLVFVDPELAGQFSRSIAHEGDLVFTCWGTINQVGLIDSRAQYREYLVSNKQMKLTPNSDRVLPLFLYYWFSGPEGQAAILAGGIGSSVPGFNLGQLRQMKVPIPSLEEQRQVIDVLSALDDKIDLNRRMNETLDAMARAIFKDWFVDFGPTRAKMEGCTPYLAPDLWALFPERLDGEKPEGSTTGTLKRYATLNPESWSRTTYPETVRYVDLSATKWGRIEAIGSLPRDSAPSRAQRILRPGDTIVGVVRPGNGSFALIGTKGLTGSTGFAVLRPKQAYFRRSFTSPRLPRKMSSGSIIWPMAQRIRL